MMTGSAKIIFKTIDISELVPALATSIGAIVVGSNQGDVDNPVLITNKAQFIQEYGKPSVTDYAKQAALGFLQTGRRLYCMRAMKSALYGGVGMVTSASANSNAAIAAGVADPALYSWRADECFAIFGCDPGVWNNGLAVEVTLIDAATYQFNITVYQADEDGILQEVESWDVSRYAQVDGYGSQMYLENKINGASAYIKVKDNTSVANTTLPKMQATTLNFATGADGTTPGDTELVAAWDKFTNILAYPVNILINGGYTNVAVQSKMKTIAEARVDCTCVLDAPYSVINSVGNTVTWRTSTQNFNSSFCALYAPWIKIFDEYNGQLIDIPPSGDIAAVYAYTDFIYGSAHGAPAGYNRGILSRALRLSFGSDLTKLAYTPAEMDTLDDANINTVLNDPGWGILVFGEDTEQTKKSALSNVHVRRLINQISVATTRSAKAFLFEPLLERTYFRVRTVLEQYFAELEGLGAFDNVSDRGWKVVCDASNNPASVRDLNELHIWLFVKPVKVAKYIEIKCIITRSTASFEAIIAAGIV